MSNLPRIPSYDLLGPADRFDTSLSPDGQKIAYVSQRNSCFILHIASVHTPTLSTTLCEHPHHPFRSIYWARNDRQILVLYDNQGDENCKLDIVNIDGSGTTTISGERGSETRLLALSDDYPDEVLIEINDRDAAFYDSYRLNLSSGERELVEENHRFTWVYADHFLRPRLAEARLASGGIEYFTSSGDGDWKLLLTISSEDEMMTRPFRLWETTFGFDKSARSIYAMDSRGQDKASLCAWDLETGHRTELASDPEADISGLIVDPTTHELIAWTQHNAFQQFRAQSPDWSNAMGRISGAEQDHINLLGQSRDNRYWLLGRSSAISPVEYELFDSVTDTLTPLFSSYPQLATKTLSPSIAPIVQSRDGLSLQCYLTQSNSQPEDGPPPLVALIHGGPWIRDTAEFDPWVQLLANRGYSVLKVNFRGSAGFGKAFVNAGNREWGERMNDDVIDAIQWCVSNKMADPERLAVMGASFGGHATLMSLVRYPQLFRCGIDLFGPTSLQTFLESIPSHWKAHAAMWRTRLGSVDTPEDKQQLDRQSPLYRVSEITRPVMIGQGSNDPRVVQAESDQMAQALEQQDITVKYMVFEDEGHGFDNPDNLLLFFEELEGFLAQHMERRESPESSC